MSRVNWMNIGLAAVLVVCLLLAFAWNWFQWLKMTDAREAQTQLRKQVAMQELNMGMLQKQHKPLQKTLAAPDSKKEDGEFLNQLRALMEDSKVRPVLQEPAPVVPLPTIGAPATPEAGTTQAADQEKARPEPSLVNMPLGVRAITTRLSVQGNFLNVRHFMHQVYNSRYRMRAININSAQLGLVDDKGDVRATLMLTRFVYPGDSPIRSQNDLEPTGSVPTGSNPTSSNSFRSGTSPRDMSRPDSGGYPINRN